MPGLERVDDILDSCNRSSTVLATIVEWGKGRLGYKDFRTLNGFLWNILVGNRDGLSRIIWKHVVFFGRGVLKGLQACKFLQDEIN